jgi:hypothetical protein
MRLFGSMTLALKYHEMSEGVKQILSALAI